MVGDTLDPQEFPAKVRQKMVTVSEIENCPPHHWVKVWDGRKRKDIWRCRKCGEVGNPADFIEYYDKGDISDHKLIRKKRGGI